LFNIVCKRLQTFITSMPGPSPRPRAARLQTIYMAYRTAVMVTDHSVTQSVIYDGDALGIVAV